MAMDGIPTMEEFEAMYGDYMVACRDKDADYLRAMLPPDIPKGEFDFVLNISQQTAQGIDSSGIKPRIEQAGNSFNVIYEIIDGDDFEKMVIDFYYRDGSWWKSE